MKILIACDKFKGSLKAVEVCKAIARGIQKYDSKISCNLHPIADGGDGSLAIIANYLETSKITVDTIDPLGKKIKASYLISGANAYFELAAASGIVLLSDSERNPMRTHTTGTGLLMKDALSRNIRNFYLLAGGSATNDAATGIAHAIGFQFFNKDKKELEPTGANLQHIHSIGRPKNIEAFNLTVFSDVSNPLYGPQGAAHVYAAQKGASDADIIQLNEGLINFSNVLKKQFRIDISQLAGGGCAGGIGAGLVGLFNAKLENGFTALSKLTHLEEKIRRADLVISGEGKLDHQTFNGKVVAGVSQLCHSHNKPLIVFAGNNQLTNNELNQLNIRKAYSILSKSKSTPDAMKNGEQYLELLSYNMMTDIGLTLEKLI